MPDPRDDVEAPIDEPDDETKREDALYWSQVKADLDEGVEEDIENDERWDGQS